MAFSINTNVASLSAQNYLRINSEFQNKTINRVTSGLRIVQSGDDAAGLAIANGYRSDQAVLTQGVRNANDGISQLQIIDGGMNNISQLLDRARTLATQSATGTFTGDRAVLNNEFQSVLLEIDRQAQSIGLDTSGIFAKLLSVFIGGGKGTGAAAAITNGSVSVDLSHATVDSKSLGLKGYTAGYQVAAGAADTGLYDLGASSATSVAAIKANTGATTTSFIFSGGGFSRNWTGSLTAGSAADNSITVTVNLAQVSDTNSLVAAINTAIAAAGSAGSAAANAFRNANITASIHTGTDGHQQLLFSSSNASFQVEAGNTTANGFMGNLGTNTGGSATNATSTPEALSDTSDFQSGGASQISTAWTTGLVKATPEKQVLTLTAYTAAGTASSTTINVDATNAAGANMTAAEAAGQINLQLQQTDNPVFQQIVASASQAGDAIVFSSPAARFDMTIAVNSGVAGHGVKMAAGTAQGLIVTGAPVGVGANADISNQSSAQSAVTALAAAVSALGQSQATVGKGENVFNFAVNLAQSQLTNLATAESRIRDADLAAEAANLTKAQILLQAGVAALAQANSAPQQVLSLLRS